MKSNSGMLQQLLLLMTLLAAPPLHAQVERFVEGTHYRVLPDTAYRAGLDTADGKADVLEVFWYGCGSCAAFDPGLEAWATQHAAAINFSRSPVIWNDATMTHARLFFAARELGIGAALHEPVFAAIHREGNHLLDEPAIHALFREHGAEATAVQSVWNSFAVDSALRKAQALQREWRLPGVPALVVEGRYLINLSGAVPGYDDMLQVAKFLAEKSLQQAR